METVKRYWKTLLICLLCILIGILLTRVFTRKPADIISVSIDSIKTEDLQVRKKYELIYDSLDRVLKQKDQVNTDLQGRISAISRKYEMLRNTAPNVDTIVKTHEVYIGLECLEKLPLIEAELFNTQSQVADLKFMVTKKDEQIKLTQGLIDKALILTESQQQELKKMKRKNKWLKIGIISETVVVFGGMVYLLAQ